MAQDGNDSGDGRFPGETSRRPERQVYSASHARPPGAYVAALYYDHNSVQLIISLVLVKQIMLWTLFPARKFKSLHYWLWFIMWKLTPLMSLCLLFISFFVNNFVGTHFNLKSIIIGIFKRTRHNTKHLGFILPTLNSSSFKVSNTSINRYEPVSADAVQAGHPVGSSARHPHPDSTGDHQRSLAVHKDSQATRPVRTGVHQLWQVPRTGKVSSVR